MTQDITSKIDAAIIWAMNNTIIPNSPYKTGNLRDHGIKLERGKNYWRIWVDADEPDAIAFYMKYTNEDWSNFAPPLQGKTNPHKGWWQREVANFMDALNSALSGKMVKK